MASTKSSFLNGGGLDLDVIKENVKTFGLNTDPVKTPPKIELQTPDIERVGLVDEPVVPGASVTPSALKSDFGLTTLENQKEILSGKDALTSSLFSEQAEVGAARAASARGKAGQEAELRGLSETQEAGAVADTERAVENIRQSEQATLSQQALANSRQAGQDILRTETAIQNQKEDEYNSFIEGFNFGTDNIEDLQQKYVDTFGGTAPSFSDLVDSQLDANESKFGANVTNYIQTQGYNIGNIPVQGADIGLDSKLYDLYNAQFDKNITGDNLTDAYASWRKDFMETTVSSDEKNALETARAEKESSLQGRYPEWNINGSEDQARYNSELDTYDAETADGTDSGWKKVTLPNGEEGWLDDRSAQEQDIVRLDGRRMLQCLFAVRFIDFKILTAALYVRNHAISDFRKYPHFGIQIALSANAPQQQIRQIENAAPFPESPEDSHALR